MEVDSRNVSKAQLDESTEVDLMDELLRRKLISKPFEWCNEIAPLSLSSCSDLSLKGEIFLYPARLFFILTLVKKLN